MPLANDWLDGALYPSPVDQWQRISTVYLSRTVYARGEQLWPRTQISES